MRNITSLMTYTNVNNSLVMSIIERLKHQLYNILYEKPIKPVEKSYSRNYLIDIEKRKGINVRTEWLEVKIMCLQAEWRLRIGTIKMKSNMLVWQQLGIIKSFMPIVNPLMMLFVML